ncbi:hypothetical protein MCOR27_006286 [Pyricularia oryzae]|uniref:S-adenosyl-L-methionine-dependent methyltransferase n=1 Tax=Pyricularia grisea TaxID=148305 RepID=A0ABQ8NQ25_PYRGI|nr:hypothetical protein MCOR01_011508 [Pyricularia oryzae]KAI6300443.1 hypothetical protein MCOR33_003847 [Pyricularia grisea]KAI6262675.1 hypothetical protein MCOR19_001184 [Pyricularia oryzae]KAI6276876.1 hypothetical protein MCOR27_006286 [Pyricularia oryzae]KAI6277183.1 hypothetical protein MCOR26_005255 [Pyricularia oryzae]
MTATDLDAENLASWVTNAQFWDDSIGAGGNVYWRKLQEPSLRRLVSAKIEAAKASAAGGRALDISTGNGLCARWLVDEGIPSVRAVDGSSGMIEVAKARMAEAKPRYDGIQIGLLDVTDRAAFAREIETAAEFGGYDVILMNMAIQDVPTLEPLVEALPKLLKKDGIFFGTLLHPVFLTSGAARDIKLTWVDGELVVERARIVKDYMSIPPYRGLAIPGQPAKQVYYHRNFQDLFAPFFQAGLVLDKLEELAFSEGDGEPDKIESTLNFTQIPVMMSFRVRRGD